MVSALLPVGENKYTTNHLHTKLEAVYEQLNHVLSPLMNTSKVMYYSYSRGISKQEILPYLTMGLTNVGYKKKRGGASIAKTKAWFYFQSCFRAFSYFKKAFKEILHAHQS